MEARVLAESEEEIADVFSKLYNELGDPTPRWTHWVCGALPLAFIMFLLIWGGAAVTGLRYARLQHDFIRMSKGRVKIEELLRNPKYRPLVSSQQTLVEKLLPLFSMVNAGELSRALRMLERPETPKHPFLHVLTARLRVVSGDDEVFQKLREDERFSSKSEPALWQRYVELKTEAAKVLEFPANISVEHEFAFYQGGAFAGLPVFAGVPDNISSFEVLTGFAPKLRKPTPAERERLKTRLSSLSESGLDLSRQIGNLSLKSDTRKSTLNTMSSRHQKAEREAKALIRRFVVELAYQPLPQRVRESYDILKVALETKHIYLPELLVIERQKNLSEDEISAALDSELSKERF